MKFNKALLVSFAPLTLLATSSLATSCEQSKQPLIHDPVLFKTPKVADVIYTVDGWKFDSSVNTMLQSLQGILAQDEAQIFVYSGVPNRDEWFGDMQKKYNFRVIHVANPWDLVERFKSAFNSKYVLYKTPTDQDKQTNHSINHAGTIAGVEKYLMISQNLEMKARMLGLTLGRDATNLKTIDVFNEYKDRLNHNMMLNQNPVDFALRDYGIAAKVFETYLDYEDEEVWDAIDPWLDDAAPMLGWTATETAFIERISKRKMCMIASDHCFNLSLFSNDKPEYCYVQPKRPKITPDKNKHYVAIVMSDGDNVQWLQNDFRFPDWYGNKHRGKFPMTWTISPAAIDMNPQILDNLYRTMSPNDHFIAGPSGYTYMNPAWFDKSGREEFAKRTAAYMHDCGMSYFNPLDFIPSSEGEPVPDYHCMDELLAQDQIKGAIWSVTDWYLDGKGSVDWINDKPIVSFREGLWNIAGEGDHQRFSYDHTAERINSYPCDPYDIEGYTLVMAQSWTEGKMPTIDRFVKALDEHVEIVTADQLLEMITQYVPHVSDKPEHIPPEPTK